MQHAAAGMDSLDSGQAATARLNSLKHGLNTMTVYLADRDVTHVAVFIQIGAHG